MYLRTRDSSTVTACFYVRSKILITILRGATESDRATRRLGNAEMIFLRNVARCLNIKQLETQGTGKSQLASRTAIDMLLPSAPLVL